MQRCGQKVTLRLSDAKEIDTKISYIIKQESGDIMIILKTNKAVEDLISYRKISIDVVWWSYSGLKIPNSALVEEEGKYYVIRNRTGYKDKILIKIQKQNKNYSIIENYQTSELAELGYNEKEIENMKSISLYDEILAKPEK